MKRTLARIAALVAVGVALASPSHQAISQTANGYPLNSIAAWDITKAAYFLLDNDGGDDTKDCVVYATPGATITPTGHVCKTVGRLQKAIPKIGNDRQLVLLIKPRAASATYKKADGVTDDDFVLSSIVGYHYLLVRGSTDLTNSATDRQLVGMQTAFAGPNGNGSWTAAGGSSTDTTTVAAGSLPSDSAGAHFRLRFTGDVTGALANVSTTIFSIVSGTITFTQSMAAAHVNNDTFFIEAPGVVFKNVSLGVVGAPVGAPTSSAALVGVRTLSTGSMTFRIDTMGFSLAGAQEAVTALTFPDSGAASNGSITVGGFYLDEAGTSRRVGGCRFEGPLRFTTSYAVLSINDSGFMSPSGNALDIRSSPISSIGRSGAVTVANTFVAIQNNSSVTRGQPSFPTFTLGNLGVAGVPKSRVLGGSSGGCIVTNSTGLWASGVTLTGCGAFPGINVSSDIGSNYVFEGIVGSTGNTDVGISVDGSLQTTVAIGTSTVSGSLGEVRLFGNALTTYAGLALTNVVDTGGNNVYDGLGGYPRVGPGVLGSNTSGGALGVGAVVRFKSTSGDFTSAQGSSSGNATGALCVLVTPPASGALAYAVCTGTPYVLFDGTPTLGDRSFLSTGTAGKLTTTTPASSGSNQKRRCPAPVTSSGSTGRVPWACEIFPVAADGNP